ncbi:MAG: hypothetical protein H6819_00345 [Phycisphaerales bacterium]|nr:hypothetical protein [Phycisphaerales bacterium]MCB9857342.1 hypothetical protein [Phycisphaerales bacterium]
MNDAAFKHLPFVIDAAGQFSPACVSVKYDSAERPSTPELDAIIAEEWERQSILAKRHDRLLFNGSLLRYLSHRVDLDGDGRPARFAMTVGPTNYRDFVGTNLFHHDRLEEFGWERFSNPVGTTATLLTSDGLICYGRRSAKVSYHAEHVHTFGGAFEEADRLADGSIDPFASVAREITEELAIAREELIDLTCVGLVRDKEIYQPELLFEASLPMTFEDVRERWRTAEGADEHDSLVALADAPEAIVPFVLSCGPIAPVAVGALFLRGLHRWGEGWFEAAARELAMPA